MHPEVSVFWNIWPFPLIVWSIFRVPLNIIFFPVYIPLAWTWQLWNFVPELMEYISLTMFGTLFFVFAVFSTFFAVLGATIPSAILFWFLTFVDFFLES